MWLLYMLKIVTRVRNILVLQRQTTERVFALLLTEEFHLKILLVALHVV